MLRECLKYEKVLLYLHISCMLRIWAFAKPIPCVLIQVARRILFSDQVWVLFDCYVHLPNFDVASDAFTTLK